MMPRRYRSSTPRADTDPSGTHAMNRQVRRRYSGFTLIELLIAMAVLVILAAIAIPSYSEYISRARRVEARGVLTQAAQWMERYRAENRGVYTNAVLPVGLRTSPDSGSPMYDVTLSTLTATTYVLSAAPIAGRPMAADVCGTLTLASDGRRTAATLDSGTLYERCWQR
jgi:type IV pilus assembly protein PilE